MKKTLRNIAKGTVGCGITAVSLALLLTACAAEGDTLRSESGGGQGGSAPETLAGVPLNFDAYMQRTKKAQTRAGLGGDINNTDVLQTGTHKDVGFGVFGYYTDRALYGKTSIPNFMYNQQVLWDATNNVFSYTPLKFWPNEYSGAQAQDNDRVSFFAYAPHVRVNSLTGLPEGDTSAGITQVSRRDDDGDPLVTYVMNPHAGEGVDLMWGTVPSDIAVWGPDDATVTLQDGMPWLNLTRAKETTDKVKFQFRHALTKFNVTVDAVVDEVEQGSGTLPTSGKLDANTRIFVRSITFTGFTRSGALNLNNLTAREPRWMAEDGEGWLPREDVTFYDQRYDSREGISANEAETPGGLNDDIVQQSLWTDTNPADPSKPKNPGVTIETVNLFRTAAGASEAPLYVIPNGDALTVTIEYDIETKDDLIGRLSDGTTPGVSIPCRITKTKVIDNLSAGNYYKLKLHLGMNSVKMDALVGDWEAEEDLNPTDDYIPVSQFNQLVSIQAWTDHEFDHHNIGTTSHD